MIRIMLILIGLLAVSGLSGPASAAEEKDLCAAVRSGRASFEVSHWTPKGTWFRARALDAEEAKNTFQCMVARMTKYGGFFFDEDSLKTETRSWTRNREMTTVEGFFKRSPVE